MLATAQLLTLEIREESPAHRCFCNETVHLLESHCGASNDR